MKNTLYIILIFTIIFSACKKEESNSNTTSGDIIGSWSMTSFTFSVSDGYYTDYPNGKVYDEEGETTNMNIPGTWAEDECGVDISLNAWYFNFQDDGNLIITMMREYEGVVDINIDTNTYLKQGDNIIIDNDELATITKLNSTNLTIETSNSDTSHNYLTNDGYIHFWEEEATYQFTRED
tara:strand:- start:1786 stop:2325 length:540 start_codon:yes stop_codon:yes gene_type:complete